MTAGDEKGWEYHDAEGWKHCGRSAWLDDDGATCSKCQAFTGWDDEEGLES